MLWHASRASGELLNNQVYDITSAPSDMKLQTRFALQGAAVDIDGRVGLFLNLIAQTLVTRVWSLLPFETCLPYSLAVVYHEKEDVVLAGLQRIRETAEALQKFEAMISSSATSKAFKRSLLMLSKDLYWTREPLAREILLVCHKNEWKPTAEVKQLAWCIFAPACNTKRTLEDTFKALHDTCKTTRNSVVSQHRMYFDCHMAPELRGNDHWQHWRLPSSDWSGICPVPATSITEAMFSSVRHKPSEELRPSELLAKGKAKVWQPAGPGAEFRKASATQLLLMQAPSNFETLGTLPETSLSYVRRWPTILTVRRCLRRATMRPRPSQPASPKSAGFAADILQPASLEPASRPHPNQPASP
jgi:hypothetical protein